MKTWITDSVPSELTPDSLQINVNVSKQVAVLVSSKHSENYIAIAIYNDYNDLGLNKIQGHWRISGHNGNWDHRVIGWYPLPDII